MRISKSFFILFLIVFSTPIFAQIKMREVFANMPDSLLPMVTKNNRLDCIDFIENNMQARVKNKMDEYVELKQLTDNYLLFQLSDVSSIELKLIPQTDTTSVICMVETCKGPAVDSNVMFFTQEWRKTFKPLFERRPTVDAFFPVMTEQNDSLTSVLHELQELPLMEAKLSPTDYTITWTLSIDELSKAEKEMVQECLRPIRWNLSN